MLIFWFSKDLSKKNVLWTKDDIDRFSFMVLYYHNISDDMALIRKWNLGSSSIYFLLVERKSFARSDGGGKSKLYHLINNFDDGKT
jgi:hypothetical protein